MGAYIWSRLAAWSMPSFIMTFCPSDGPVTSSATTANLATPGGISTCLQHAFGPSSLFSQLATANVVERISKTLLVFPVIPVFMVRPPVRGNEAAGSIHIGWPGGNLERADSAGRVGAEPRRKKRFRHLGFPIPWACSEIYSGGW